MATPLCPYFGQCGGCSFQDIDYSEQLELKKKRIIKALKIDDLQVFFGQEYYYRQRMDMVFHPEGLGFRQRGSWSKIIKVERCLISNEKLNQLLTEVSNFFTGVDTFEARENKGTFRYAVIRTPPDDSSVSIVVNNSSPHISQAEKKVIEFASQTSAHNVLITYVPPNRDVSVSDEYSVIKGSEWLQEEYLGKKFWYHVQGFFQNNHQVAEKMHAHCQNSIKNYGDSDSVLLDLYGGVGPFAILNAQFFKEALIIDNSARAIKGAAMNIKENKVSNVKPMLLDSKDFNKAELPRPRLVVVDPPRSGLHPKVIKKLNDLKPEIIIYVSCNLKQLKHDLGQLKNFQLKRVALFDLFPQTPHIETVVELEGVRPLHIL